MQSKICGIILKVTYPCMGDTSEIEILGKSMLEWVSVALGDSLCAAVPYSDNVQLPLLVRPHLRDSDYTVVLFSDTPLITRKTVLDAVYDLSQSGENCLKMTRGYVFKTSYLQNAVKLYSDNQRYYDEEDFLTAFSFKQTAMVSEVLRNRILSYHMSHGVQFEDPASTFVGCDVVIGKGSVIGASNTLKGKTVLKENVRLLTGNTVIDSFICEGCVVESSKLDNAKIGRNVKIGPFAHLRPDSIIGDGCRIGNFVEIKKSIIGQDTKVAHLTYIGDAEIGKNCNIGCGTVFCNYDGKNKRTTVIGDNVFVGSNANLIAPLKIGNGAFIAAGSTITDDIGESSLAIARARQVNKPNWKK